MMTATFAPGFRLSVLDAVVLVAAGVGSVLLSLLAWWLGFVVAFVVGHFFVFCNVFRIARKLELTWAGIFGTLAVTTIALEVPGWPVTIAVALFAAVVMVALEARKPLDNPS
jgi:hypothetical protein